jgi:small subunit ribosomal protein S1
VDLGDGISGLVHVSQMSTKRVENPEEVCKEGDTVKVKITRVKDGKVSLSMKALEEAPAAEDSDIPDLASVVSHEKATTSLGDLLKNIKLD